MQSKAKPSQAKQRKAKKSKPSQAKQSKAKPSKAKQSQAKPSQSNQCRQRTRRQFQATQRNVNLRHAKLLTLKTSIPIRRYMRHIPLALLLVPSSGLPKPADCCRAGFLFFHDFKENLLDKHVLQALSRLSPPPKASFERCLYDRGVFIWQALKVQSQRRSQFL